MTRWLDRIVGGPTRDGQAADQASPDLPAEERPPDSDVERLLAEGLHILERERRLCRAGALDQAIDLAAEKEAFAERLSAALTGALAVPGAVETKPLRKTLDALVARARENERLIAAAREGVRAAARRLHRFQAAQAGAVAYGPDGAMVQSREDAAGRSKRA